MTRSAYIKKVGFVPLMLVLLGFFATKSQGAVPIIEFFRSSEGSIDSVRPVRLWWKVQNANRVDVYDGFKNTVYPLSLIHI
jgi:hypothetical protein